MFRRPGQDRMTSLCIDQQLAIDAEKRREGRWQTRSIPHPTLEDQGNHLTNQPQLARENQVFPSGEVR
jgi:hypothetical protein